MFCLLEREQQLKKARIWAQAVAEQHRQAVGESGPARLVEIVTGQAVIKQRIDHVLRLAQRDICCFDKPPYILIQV